MTSISILRPPAYTDDIVVEWFREHTPHWSKGCHRDKSGKPISSDACKIENWFRRETHKLYACKVEVFRWTAGMCEYGYPKAYLLDSDHNIGYLVWDIDELYAFHIQDCIWDERFGCYLTV